MAEEAKKERTVQQVQNEYAALCTRAGHLQYQIEAQESDLKIINNTLRDLNLEAFKLQQDAAKVAEAVKAATAAQAPAAPALTAVPSQEATS